ncbi:MAG: LysM protein [Bacteroidetes bacterium]|nr:LysM protein [Bacteroidota bacterium]
MNLKKMLSLMIAGSLCLGVAQAQEKMTKDEWQQEINKHTSMVNDLKEKIKALNDQVGSLQSQSSKLDADYEKCLDELYALVGSDRAKADAYRAEIEAAENNANELMRLSDADLMARSSEVTDLAAKVKSLWENKLSLIPEFWDMLTALNDKVKSLQATLAGSGKTYTVGTWRRDRDCLWNISKKKDIYDNAWMWPKIWQGNRDQIKDPDIIHTGQKLKIPTAGAMTATEKAAAKSYYSKKAAK